MLLYHFTSGANLRAIAACGLTVGDVPTDIFSVPMRGVVGVWFTTSDAPSGHGLGGSLEDKKRFRLDVEMGDHNLLKNWADWSIDNVTPDTRAALHKAGGEEFKSWYVFFGSIRPERIIRVTDMRTGLVVHDWPNAWGEGFHNDPVPYRGRHAWLKQTIAMVEAASGRHR